MQYYFFFLKHKIQSDFFNYLIQYIFTTYFLRIHGNCFFQFTLRINTQFLVFPLIHHATTSSDHNTTFYPIQKLPNFSNPTLLLYLSQTCFDLPVCCCSLVRYRFCSRSWRNLRSPKYLSVLRIGVPYSCSFNFYSTSVCFSQTNDFFAVSQGRLC